MKYSIYNNFVHMTNSVACLYNAASDKFVLYKEIESIQQYTPGELELKNPDLYKELCKVQAIIEDDVNEYEIQKNLSDDIRTNNNHFQLMINPTLDCNLHCWYCYEHHIKGSSISATTMQGIFRFVDNVFQSLTEMKLFTLSLFGGEPLLEFECVKNIIMYIDEKCHNNNVHFQVSITSNGVLIDEQILDFFNRNNLDLGFQITLDGNREEHNKTRYTKSRKGTYDQILKNVSSLLNNNINVILRINYTSKNFKSIALVAEDISNFSDSQKSYLRIDLQRVWQDIADDLDVEYLMEQFRKYGFVVTSPLLDIDDLKHPCYADYTNQILINYNGDVYKCSARDFSKENRIGYLTEEGNVNWILENPYERLLKYKESSICSQCSIYPLCGGGCIQKRSELKEDICMYNINEQRINEIVLNRFYRFFVKKQ